MQELTDPIGGAMPAEAPAAAALGPLSGAVAPVSAPVAEPATQKAAPQPPGGIAPSSPPTAAQVPAAGK